VPDSDVLVLASEMEGHPDNVAPALVGGFTFAAPGTNGRSIVVRRDVHPAVRAVLFSAHEASSTHHARGLLPDVVPHADAAANAATAALLVHAITEDPSLLLPATVDRLHQRYRAAAMPTTARLVSDLRAAGIAAVVSGAGPSVLALGTEVPDLDRWQRPGFEVAEVAVAPSGATVLRSSVGSVAR
jgi:homoserine kinase